LNLHLVELTNAHWHIMVSISQTVNKLSSERYLITIKEV